MQNLFVPKVYCEYTCPISSLKSYQISHKNKHEHE